MRRSTFLVAAALLFTVNPPLRAADQEAPAFYMQNFSYTDAAAVPGSAPDALTSTPISLQDPAAKPQDPAASSSSSPTSANGSKIDSPSPNTTAPADTAQQTKRILWIVPNFRSVSADTKLPPMKVREKFWLATQDSFDYSSVIYSGLIAGVAMAGKSEPTFGQGASGYGTYFAHTFADGTIENYMVEAVVPTLTREDPRYYTLGKGGFRKRTLYAVSRLFITRTDGGNKTFNFSEVVGAGAAAGIGNSYYSADTNVWVKTYQRWLSQLVQDAVGNFAKEFWPEVNRAVFHNKY